MAAFFNLPPRTGQPPEGYATPLGRGRILPRAEMNNRTVHDNFGSPPLLSPDDFVLRSSNNVTGTSGLTLPKFWDGGADLYFSTIETIFRVRGINSEQSKLDSLLAALDIRHFRFLEHVLPDLNAQNAYSKTKSVLLQHFAPSSDDKLERLLNGSRLSDRTSPSKLLAEMRSLLGESGSQDRLLRKLFLDRLPAGVRRIIVSHPVEDLDQLAKIADRVMEENRKCTSGFGDGPEYNDYASSIGTSNVSLSTLHETVTDLAQTVTSLTHSLQSMPHTPDNFPNTRDNNATTTSFSQRSPVARDTSPSRSSTSVRLRSFSPSPSSSGHSRSWSPRRRPAWGDRPTEVNALFKGYQGIDLELLAPEQLQDPKVLELRRSNTTSLCLKEHTVPDSDSPLLLDTSLFIPRVIVPYNLRKHVFDAVHSLSHPGIRASRQLISERFVWEGMQKDIAEFTRACVPCQQSKIHRHNSAPLQSFLQPDSRFSAIHCDLVGPLPESCGHAYLLTIIDRFTRHLECIPLREITAKACADAFVLNWVARFGCPQIMTCDRGVQFTSHLWEELCKFLGCKLVHTTAFHPESNGFLERQHRTLKAALKAQENPRDWFSNLGFVLLGIRSSPKSDFEVSSAQLCLGTSLRLPGQFFEPSSETPRTEYCAQLCQFMSTLRAPPPHHHGTPRSYVEKALQTCTHVFVKNDTARSSFDRPYKGPYRVLNKGDKFFTLDLFTRRDVVSIDRLRAAHLLTPDKEPETQQPVEGRSHPLPIQPSQPEASFHSYDEQPKSILRTLHGRIIHKPKRYVHFLLPTH